MNKITFCTFPDIIDNQESYGLKNYDNTTIKNILNNLDQNITFYLIDENLPNEWLNNCLKKVKIIFDCKKTSLQQIITICQNKKI